MRVLIIDIDSLRPDHLGCYGYDRETTPTIDRVASEGVRFENCYASDTPCLPSRTSLITCRFGAKHGAVTHWGSGQWYDQYERNDQVDTDHVMAPTYLSQEGIKTATVSIFAQRHRAYHWDAAFRESIQPTGRVGLNDKKKETNAAMRWLDANATEDDWLLHVNYWDVHHPYVGIDPFVEEVRNSGPAAPWPDEEALGAQQGMTGMHCADVWTGPRHYENYEVTNNRFLRGEWEMPMRYQDRADVEQLIDGYDASVRKVDTEIERLLGKLRAEGVRDDVAVVITGDHGEALGEHGIYAEHSLAHPACQNVPLIVDWPGVTDGLDDRVVDEHVYQFDLMATICDVAGLDIPAGWDAKPFTPALDGDSFEGRADLVCGHGIYLYSRAVYRDDWVYIRLLHPGVFSMPGLYNDPELPNDGLTLLHDLSTDPNMTENLIGERPEVAAALGQRMDEWTAEVSATTDAAGRDPLLEMAATDGPFLYLSPDELIGFYRKHGRTQEQIDAVDRSRAFPERM